MCAAVITGACVWPHLSSRSDRGCVLMQVTNGDLIRRDGEADGLKNGSISQRHGKGFDERH